MYLPYWFWEVRFRTSAGGGETLVVAPHPAGAKQSIAASIEGVTAFESVEPHGRVSTTEAEQRFAGYYPGVRTAISTLRQTP